MGSTDRISAEQEKAIARAVHTFLDGLVTPFPPAWLTLAEARRMALACEEEARRLGIAVVFCAVDLGGAPLLLQRMDAALRGSVLLAQRKAGTATAYARPTHELYEACQPGRELYGMQHEPDVTIVGGGYPCLRNGAVIGGVGVSGGTVEQDMLIATRALELL